MFGSGDRTDGELLREYTHIERGRWLYRHDHNESVRIRCLPRNLHGVGSMLDLVRDRCGGMHTATLARAGVLRDDHSRRGFCGLSTRGRHCLPPRLTDGEDARCDGHSLCREIGFNDSAAYNFIRDLYDAAHCGSDSHEE
jgi:hypothetical protein